MSLSSEAAFGRELPRRPLLQPAPAVPRLAVAEGWQQELAELPALAQLVDSAFGDAKHPRDMRDGAAGGEDVTDLERAIRNVEAARTLLRLHTLVLSDLLAGH